MFIVLITIINNSIPLNGHETSLEVKDRKLKTVGTKIIRRVAIRLHNGQQESCISIGHSEVVQILETNRE